MRRRLIQCVSLVLYVWSLLRVLVLPSDLKQWAEIIDNCLDMQPLWWECMNAKKKTAEPEKGNKLGLFLREMGAVLVVLSSGLSDNRAVNFMCRSGKHWNESRASLYKLFACLVERVQLQFDHPSWYSLSALHSPARPRNFYICSPEDLDLADLALFLGDTLHSFAEFSLW